MEVTNHNLTYLSKPEIACNLVPAVEEDKDFIDNPTVPDELVKQNNDSASMQIRTRSGSPGAQKLNAEDSVNY